MAGLTLRQKWITAVLLLYVVALHTSMAAMEILVWTLCLTVIVRLVRDREWPVFTAWMPILGMIVCTALSVLLNPPGRGFWFQLGFFRWAIILWLLPYALREVWSDEFERKLLMVWVGMCALCAAYALFQTCTGIDVIRPSAHVVSQSRGIWRPVGFFSRSLAFAYSFGFSLIAVSLPAWRRWPKWWTVAFLTIGLFTVIATESRGAWIGLLAAVGVFLAIEHRKMFGVFIVVAAASALALSQSQTEIGVKVANMLSGTLDHSSGMRWHLWQAYWQMWKEHPWFGVGLFQGDLIVPNYYHQLGIQEDFVSNAHNVYLQWLAGAGIFSLLFFFWVSATFLINAWKIRRNGPWGWSVLMAQIFLLVGGFTEDNFFTAITLHMVIFNWSILVMLDH